MSDQHKNEKMIFMAALRLRSAAERETYLRETCGNDKQMQKRVKALLEANDIKDDFLEAPAYEPNVTVDTAPITESPGTIIGRYKLLEKIGEGGMAVVYMAEQKQPIHRRVALKIIKLGMDTKAVIGRFEAERQALAMMDHPNIAHIYDAGATESGRPYFVMELVKGASITEFCDKNNLNTQERLELFISVCQAVQHAHQKGIIHRDIKPSNVMVTLHDGQPVPKVIDFGIAKAVNQQLTEKTVFTRYAQMIGTPEYMSPEQAEMSGLGIDIRSDVYSLGTLLYELLTGTTPLDAEYLRGKGYAELQRIIREEEPTKPSTKISTLGEALIDIAKHRRTSPDLLQKLIRADLDWIVMKTLEKDRNRRYDSVSEFAADIKRYLNNEPVLAGPPSTLYWMRKFIRRRRGLVTATAAVAAALLIGLIVSTVMYFRVDMALKREASALTEAQTVTDFLTNDLLESVYPEKAKGKEVTVRYILETATRNLNEKFSDNPLPEAKIRQAVGLTYQKMGDYPSAEPHLERALEIRERVFGEAHPETLQSMCDLAWQYMFQGRFDDAEAPALRALETGRRMLGREHPGLLSVLECCGFMYHIGFQSKKAEPLLYEGYETSRRVFGEEHERTVFFMNLLAWSYETQNRHDAAIGMAVRAFEIARRVLGPEHPYTLQAMNQLGRTYTIEGRLGEAEALLCESVELSHRVLGDGHLFTLFYTARLASLYETQREYEKMEQTLADALEIARWIPGKLMVTGYLHWRLHGRIFALSSVAREHYDTGEFDEATRTLLWQEKLRQSLEYEYTDLPPSDVALLAMSLHHLDRNDEAQNSLHHLREMLEQGEYTYEEQYLYKAEQLFLGEEDQLSGMWNLLEEGKLEEVSEVLERLRTQALRNAPAIEGNTQNFVKALARAYCIRGSRAEGRGEYHEAIIDYEAAIRTNPDCARAHVRLARLLAISEVEAVRDGARSIKHATQACRVTKWKNPSFISTLAAAHAEMGDFTKAITLQKQAIDLIDEDEREKLLSNYQVRLDLYEDKKPYHRSLVAWWTFDQSPDKLALDSSGNNLHGQLVGDAHIIETADRPGKVLQLDGDGDWVDCGNNARFNIVFGITVTCWMKVQKFDKRHQTIVSKGDNSWRLAREDAFDGLEFGCSGVAVPNNMYGAVYGKANVNDGQWHHVAGVYDGTAIHLYVDGELDVSSKASGRINSDLYAVLIGENDHQRSNGRDRSFNGFLDDVRIYDYALSESDIESLYIGGGRSKSELIRQ